MIKDVAFTFREVISDLVQITPAVQYSRAITAKSWSDTRYSCIIGNDPDKGSHAVSHIL